MEANHISLEETLLPALVQCFGIMFLGYVLGRFKVLGQKEARGISIFVQYLALPALIFGSISTMSFTDVKWEFIASVFVAKAFIFGCVVLMTILLTHPADLGKSGIYAIAATQSNDFALAYPMFLSLYKNSHPDYPSYLYIVAPIQLLVLNTIGFFIIEIQKQKDNLTKCYIWKTLKETLKNPIVFMTIVGMIWNIIFGKKVLPIFDSLLKTLSAAFPAIALFLVGHTMATKDTKSDNHISITVALLIIIKNLILPITLQKLSAFMLQNSTEDEVHSFSSLGFLYGTTPTAPSTYVFAVQYDVSVDVITKTIIGSTLLSAPLMFASASVISLSQLGIENTTFYLSLTVRYLSCASLLCCGWLLLSFIVGKRFQNISFVVTLYIFFAQLLTSIGGFLLFFPVQKYSLNFYAQYILSVGGIYATRTCTLFLAILLFIIRWRSLCYILLMKKLINVISILCLIVPFAIAGLALFSKNIETEGPACQLGHVQHILTFVLTMVCLTGTILCLILQHICFRGRYKNITERSYHESTYQTSEESINSLPQTAADRENTLHNITNDNEISIDVEDLGNFENLQTDSENLLDINVQDNLCHSRYHCSIEKRLQCANRLNTYKKEQEETNLYNDKQIFQHTTVLITMSVTMTLSLTVCFWKLIMEEIDGIFIELQFLDIITNYSFGISLFIIFGFNEGLIYTISNKWKTLRCCHEKTQTEMSSADICRDFKAKHKNNFQINMHKHLATPMNFGVFRDSDFIHWLLDNEVAKNCREAERYILGLQEGHIIETVDTCNFFRNSELIFKFTCNEI